MPLVHPQEHPAATAASDGNIDELIKIIKEVDSKATSLYNTAKAALCQSVVDAATKAINDGTTRLEIASASSNSSASTSSSSDLEAAFAILTRGKPSPINPSKINKDDDDDVDDEELEELEEDEEEEEEETEKGSKSSKNVVTKTDDENEVEDWEYCDDIIREALHTLIRENNIDGLKVSLAALRATSSRVPTPHPALCGASKVTGATALHIAAEMGHNEILTFLLAADGGNMLAYINDSELFDSSSTALHWAAIRGQTEACEILLKKGGEKLLKDVRNRDKYTAMHLAVAKGNEETFLKLLELGCDPNVPNEDEHTCLHMLLGEFCGEAADEKESTHDGAKEVSATIAALVKSGKCNLAAKDVIGWTPLVIAVTENKNAAVRLLLEAGSPISYGVSDEEDDEDGCDEDDLTEENADLPLISIAAKNGNIGIVKALVELRGEEMKKMDILTKKDKLGKTPIDWAVKAKKVGEKDKKEITRLIASISGKRSREE